MPASPMTPGPDAGQSRVSRWQGLEVTMAGDGSLRHVRPAVPDRLEGPEEDLITELAVELTGGWRHEAPELLVDEVEQRHLWLVDGRPAARAITRIVLDDVWSIRLQITNLSGDDVVVDPARLRMATRWPARRHLAGAEGSISLDTGREDGALLTFTQLRGRSRLSDGHAWLTDLPVRLGPAGTLAASYLVSWRVDWLRDERMQAATLPGWWPERTVLDAGEVVELRLPDAAVEAAGITILHDDALTILSAQPGHHIAQVHTGRGTTDVDLHWAGDLHADHLLPATERILEQDPRTLAAHEVFLLGRGLSGGGLGEWALDRLAEAVENLVARPGPTSPLAVAAVADECLRTGAADLPGLLPELVERMPAQPGALLARAQASLALRLVTGEPLGPVASPGRAVLDDPLAEAVESAIIATERACLAQEETMPRIARRTAALLGAGLPGVAVDHLTCARIHAVLGMAPESWDTSERWPLPLGTCRDLARRRLLAERCDEQSLAWLVW